MVIQISPSSPPMPRHTPKAKPAKRGGGGWRWVDGGGGWGREPKRLVRSKSKKGAAAFKKAAMKTWTAKKLMS